MCEGGKEGPDDPPDPCLLLSHCILPSPVKGPSALFLVGKLRLREVKQPVQGHEADEMDRALQTPT